MISETFKGCPPPHPGEAEIGLRQVFEIEDFPNAPPEVVEQELRQQQLTRDGGVSRGAVVSSLRRLQNRPRRVRLWVRSHSVARRSS